MVPDDLLCSPLRDWHRAHGAKMIDFHGWEMPLSHGKVFQEVATTREAVGLFDLCHMGRIHVRGDDRTDFLNLLFTGDLCQMAEFQVKYGFLCNERGGVIDDVTIYRYIDYDMLVVNASNRERVLEWMRSHLAPGQDVQIEDKTIPIAMVAIQGPRSEDTLRPLVSQPVTDLAYYHFKIIRLRDHKVLVSRTGYTGEDGYELYFGRAHALEIWQTLLERASEFDGGPVGLAARDTLRLEAAFPLHGQELTSKISPVHAGLGNFVDLRKRDFIGRDALLKSSNSELTSRLVAFEMEDRAIPRTGYSILRGDDEVGTVSSGGWSPTLDRAIGMGYVESAFSRIGTPLHIRIRDKRHPAIVVRRPFYKRGKKTQ